MNTEETLWVGHPSHWHYFWAWFFGVLLAVAVVGILIIAWIFFDRSRRTYTVTSKRVVTEWGWFSKNSTEVRIRDIRSINVKRSGLLGLFGVGDVEFSSAAADQAEVIFESIADATQIRDLVRRYQED
ncbi:MAG TPA: PH domain-containing protein [Opitutaceae bacterium]|nr:PH domain-containing protein [Opitutaceae bacterium]